MLGLLECLPIYQDIFSSPFGIQQIKGGTEEAQDEPIDYKRGIFLCRIISIGKEKRKVVLVDGL